MGHTLINVVASLQCEGKSGKDLKKLMFLECTFVDFVQSLLMRITSCREKVQFYKIVIEKCIILYDNILVYCEPTETEPTVIITVWVYLNTEPHA